MRTQSIIPLTTLLGLFIGNTISMGAISPVNSPGELSGATTINFDGYPNDTVANTLFADQGVMFTRDDGQEVFLEDWAAIGRTTTSPDNVLATVWVLDVNSSYVTHLNVLFSTPVSAIGAFFGNDQADPDYSATRLSAYDASNNLLGSVDVTANDNTSVDQFIGLNSDVPVTRIRFDNLNDSGGQSRYFSVVLDDLTFTPVPEPTALSLLGLGSLALLVMARRRR